MNPAEIKRLQERSKLLARLLSEALPWLELLEAHLAELGLADKRAALVQYITTVRKP